MNWAAFFAVHSGLDREGPGTPEDVAWACAAAGTGPDAVICDAACGPGGDLAALRAAAPEGRIVAFDGHLAFVADAARRTRDDPGVTVTQGVLIADDSGLPDPAALGPFNLIWCAGAVYFAGVERALAAWRAALTPRGAVAFSEPATFGPPDDETRAFWDGYDAREEPALDAAIARAGWSVAARRRVPDAGWEAYFAAVETRCAALDHCAVPALQEAIARERAEAAAWRRLRDRVGYVLRVVRPA